MKKLFLFFTLLFALSCLQSQAQETALSENEKKAVEEIQQFYQGICNYSVGELPSIYDSKKKYFEIELSQSKAMEEQSKYAELNAANMAYMFFRNLEEAEKSKYYTIHAVLKYANGEEMKFRYPIKKLRTVSHKMKKVNQMIDLIWNQKFDTVESMLNDSSLMQYNKHELVTRLKAVDQDAGDVTHKLVPIGFRIYYTSMVKDVLHVSGILRRSKKNHRFSIYLNANLESDDVYLIQYAL